MVAAVLFAVTVGLTASGAEIIDRILAVVDGAIIMQSDVTMAVRLGLVASASAPDPITVPLEALIERRLILEEVDRYAPPDPPDAQVDRQLDDIRARVGARFETILAESGISVDQLRRHVRDDLRIEAYLQQRFGTMQPSAIRDWIAGLRRRANVNVLPRAQ
ncbi:MAG TPA: hypothetical protein VFT39_03875 [Vicinamibacterales bacterium]|nr:hypothetical protein [Vicinamibacterales bacterium]